ncbi:4'-phosphopantetheinyl transferase [Candidatus Paraburkholderia calva]|nr:4'-phosphopantetheinyl transferase [Candidatus Paraburkholderia calva]
MNASNLHGLREALPHLPFDGDGPVFQAPWQAQAFAMTLALHARGVFTWTEWAHALSEAIRDAQAAGDPDHGDTYYAHWLDALERICTAKGCTSADSLVHRRIEWYEAARCTPHGQPILLDARRTLPTPTFEAYLAAVYRVFGAAAIDMTIGTANPAAAALIEAHGAHGAVFVTAFNPFGTKLDDAQNDTRQRALIARIGALKQPALPGEGFDPTGAWQAEASVFVPGATREMADALMIEFEQNAVVFVDEIGIPELLLHPDLRGGTGHEAQYVLRSTRGRRRAMQSSIAIHSLSHVRPVPLPAGAPVDVAVWLVTIDLAAPLAIASGGALQESEWARVRRFLRRADAVRFVTVRGALRALLGARLRMDAARLVIESDTHGRPRLTLPGAPDFNVSHSGAHGVIAISDARRVGVDIEEARASFDWRELEPMVLSAVDRSIVDALPADAQRAAFFDCWAAKEALLKAHGTGMGAGAIRMDAVSVLPRDGTRYALSVEAGAFDAAALTTPDGYAGALAWSL